MMPILPPGKPAVRIQELAPDVLMFVGDQVESVATAFVNGDQVLLVDALGSEEDAAWLRDVLHGQMGKRVRLVAATHFMSDHICGMTLFPEALTLAHRHHRHAFLSQNQPVASRYRDPDIVFDNLAMRWGRHQLRFLYNPGKTMDHMSVDVPSADLVCVGDNIVGNIVYLSRSDPALQRALLDVAGELHVMTGFLEGQGLYPTTVDSDFPVSPVAARYQRHQYDLACHRRGLQIADSPDRKSLRRGPMGDDHQHGNARQLDAWPGRGLYERHRRAHGHRQHGGRQRHDCLLDRGAFRTFGFRQRCADHRHLCRSGLDHLARRLDDPRACHARR